MHCEGHCSKLGILPIWPCSLPGKMQKSWLQWIKATHYSHLSSDRIKLAQLPSGTSLNDWGGDMQYSYAQATTEGGEGSSGTGKGWTSHRIRSYMSKTLGRLNEAPGHNTSAHIVRMLRSIEIFKTIQLQQISVKSITCLELSHNMSTSLRHRSYSSLLKQLASTSSPNTSTQVKPLLPKSGNNGDEAAYIPG